MSKNKILGIIGGMGPLATSYFFNMIINLTEAKTDQEHVHIIIDNNTNIPDRTSYILDNKKDDPLPIIKESLDRLNKMEVSNIVIPCNTSHYFIDELRSYSMIPIISLIEESRKYLETLEPSLKIAILATTGVIQTKIYETEFKNHNIDYLIPSSSTQSQIMSIIYDGVKKGIAVDKKSFFNIIDSLKKEGCTHFLLGCTELSYLKTEFNLDDTFIDPLEIISKKIIYEYTNSANK